MRRIGTMTAAAFTCLVLAAFSFDAYAQSRGGAGNQGTNASRTVSPSRKSGVSAAQDRQPAARPSTSSRTSSGTRPASDGQTVRRPSTTVTTTTRPASGTASRNTSQTTRTGQTGRTSGTPAVRPGNQGNTSGRPAAKPADRNRPGTAAGSSQTTRPAAPSRPGTAARPGTVSRPGTSTGSSSQARPDSRPAARPGNGPGASRPGTVHRQPADVRRPSDRPQGPSHVRPGQRPDVRRVHPRDREFMHYSRPSYYWTGCDHFYGHRVRIIPSHAHRHVHYGVTYYCCNDIWYRPYGGYYVVCRPPFGTVLAANLIADMTWAAVRFSYYSTVAHTYSRINENNEYIARQNEIIAANNAVIAAQNKEIARGSSQAGISYGLADELGLVQSYAAAGTDYYYQDGVFYVLGVNGEYKVIVPPAGALVETLPDDYDMVTIKGEEYYKVDDTVYRVTIDGGKPYFEVLGQMA